MRRLPQYDRTGGETSEADMAQAKDNYRLFCTQCHESLGAGRGINAPMFSIQPRNHINKKEMGTLTDNGMFPVIKNGGASAGRTAEMPHFGGVLTDKEMRDLVKHLRLLCGCYGRDIYR